MKYVVSLLMFFCSLFAHATTLNEVVVFGDSLSDRGNLYEYMNHQLPMSPPYFEGRFTNGPVWIELLLKKLYANDYDNHFLDYAYGGANVGTEGHYMDFSLQNQVKKYLGEHQIANPNALYVIWAGSNNYLDLPTDIPATCEQVIQGIENTFEVLIDKGAKNFFVVGVPDLSTTPAAIEFEAEDDLKLMSETHNNKLYAAVERLKQKYPDVQWVIYDVRDIMGDIILNPEAHGFKDGRHTCCEFMQDAFETKPSNQQIAKSKFLTSIHANAFADVKSNDLCYDYLFFDLYHPTAHAHELMADEILKLLQQKGLEFH